jgi:hypothetical protein
MLNIPLLPEGEHGTFQGGFYKNNGAALAASIFIEIISLS